MLHVAEPFGEKLPPGHALHSTVALGLCVPMVQLVQEVAPDTFKVFVADPGLHARHSTPSVGEKYPGAHSLHGCVDASED